MTNLGGWFMYHALRQQEAERDADLRELDAEIAHRGQSLRIRPIRPDDEALLQAFVRRLTPEDVRLRFFGPIRELFAGVPEARVRGYGPGRFSFNVKGGRCEHCKGDGILKIEMQFLPDVYVPCEVCAGKRYNREALEIHYRGHSIADILGMTAEEALELIEIDPLRIGLEERVFEHFTHTRQR